MKKIQLTQGRAALVDDEDYEWLNQWKWTTIKRKKNYHAHRKIWVNGKRRSVYMHRQILGLDFGDKRQGDHANSDGLDCQRLNIRICTHAQNCMNRRKQKNTSSRFKGVVWRKASQRWCARITINQKYYHLGNFQFEKDAAIVYNDAAVKYFGEFAKLNIV